MQDLNASEEKEMSKEKKDIQEKDFTPSENKQEKDFTQDENNQEVEEKMYTEPEQIFYVPTIGAETFADLDEQRVIREKMTAFQKDSKDFISLFENIVYDSEMKFSEKGKKVVSLANDYSVRIEENFNKESEEKEIEQEEGFIEKIAGRIADLLSGDMDKKEKP